MAQRRNCDQFGLALGRNLGTSANVEVFELVAVLDEGGEGGVRHQRAVVQLQRGQPAAVSSDEFHAQIGDVGTLAKVDDLQRGAGLDEGLHGEVGDLE